MLTQRKRWLSIGIILIIAALTFITARTSRGQAGGIDVLTSRYDIGRTGANINETTLTTSNVSVSKFGKIATRNVSGDMYAQPLIVSGLTINGGVHNVVYVATSKNNIYAFDADDPTPNLAPLWQRLIGNPYTTHILTQDIWHGEDGILSTPVIDRSTNTIYFTAHHNGTTGAAPPFDQPYHELRALDIRTGADKFGSPVVISGSVPKGGGGSRVYDANWHLQRSSLLLLNGYLYLGFGSIADQSPWRGWMMVYNASTLAQTAIKSFAPNQFGSAVWLSGAGPSSDGTSIYIITANGPYTYNTGGPEISDSVIRLSSTNGNLAIADYFTPSNQCYIDKNDLDLGVGAAMVVPNSNLLMAGGKQGKLYVLDRTNMGHYVVNPAVSDPCNTPGDPGDNPQIVQWFQAGTGHMHNTPVYWMGPDSTERIYTWTENDYAKGFTLSGGLLGTIPFTTSPSPIISKGHPAGMLSLSANGSTAGTGIVWAAQAVPGTEYNTRVGILRALDADDFTHVLWDSQMNSARDAVGMYAKFVPPVVANGKVYLGSFTNHLNIYGILPPPTTPTNTPTFTPTKTNAPQQTATLTPSVTTTPSQTTTLTPSVTVTPSATTTLTPSVTTTFTPSSTSTPSATFTPSLTKSLTPSRTPTFTPSVTPSQTLTMTLTPSATNTTQPTATFTPSPTSTPSSTVTLTPSLTNTPLPTMTHTPSKTMTPTATLTLSVTPTATATGTRTPRMDTIGVYSGGVFYLRNSNTAGPADISVPYGIPAYLPVTGDWNADGVDTIGVYDSANGVFLLRDSNTMGAPTYSFTFGNPGDLPLNGRWDATMAGDGVGIFRPSNGIVYLKRTLTTGVADYSMVLGNPGDTSLAGDWDSNGYDSIGVFRPTDTTFYLSDSVTNGIIFGDYVFMFGTANCKPISGDWTANGKSRVGCVMGGIVYQRYTLTTGNADNTFFYGPVGALPVAGHWQGAGSQPPASIIVPSTSVPVNPGANGTQPPRATSPSNGHYD